MALYVADTHALVWYLGGSPLLGNAAREAFDDVVSGDSRLIIPAIVLAELVMLIEKERVKADVADVVSTLHTIPNFELRPLTPEIALSIQSLTAIPDIHDRLIMAEALANSAVLVTRDQVITASAMVAVIW